MSTEVPHISPELYHYLVNYSVRETELLANLRQETALLPGGTMMSAPEQSQFLALLIRLMGATRVIEIGTFTGYSTLAMALALPQSGSIITCDIQSDAPQIGQRYWQEAGVADKIQLFITSGSTLLDELILEDTAGSFDLAFIDADKKNNHHYFEKLITLLRPGGLIAIDNVLWMGRVIDDNARDATTHSIRHFNERLKNDERVDISIIPLGDGLTLARIKE